MLHILFYITAFVALAMTGFLQHNYKIIFERTEVIRHSPNCDGKIKTFKYNRTHTAFNISFYSPTPYGNDVNVVVQAYKFASNEYREFPLRFGFQACDTIAKNDFGIKSSFNCGNFTGCPVNAGYYAVCNFMPDYSRFPPYIPAGSYMIEVQLLHKSAEMFMIQGYGTVKYPIV